MKTKMLIVGIVLAALLVTVSSVSAADVTTNKDNYEPGEIVYISGTGFTGTAITSIIITRPDDVEDSCGGCTACNADLPTVANGGLVDGNFVNYEYDLNGIQGEYTVDVSDGINSAQTTFTDGISYLNLFYPEIPGLTLSGTENINFYVNEYWGGGTVYIFYSSTGCHGTSLPSSTSGDGTWTLIGSPYYNSDGTKNYAWDTTTVPNGVNYCILIWDGYTDLRRDDDRSNNVFTVDNGCPEKSIEDILNDTYNWGCWQESTVETFFATGPDSYTAKAIVAGTNCANTNPTGWYVAGSTADTDKTQMWADPCNPTEGEQTIGPLGAGDSFGLYIDSDESGIMYYTETSLNPEAEIHAEVFKIICGDADFVVAFEDLPDSSWGVCEPDYNDVIIELRDASSEPIPEFATIAIPAVAVLGLFLFFNKRKHKKE